MRQCIAKPVSVRIQTLHFMNLQIRKIFYRKSWNEVQNCLASNNPIWSLLLKRGNTKYLLQIFNSYAIGVLLKMLWQFNRDILKFDKNSKKLWWFVFFTSFAKEIFVGTTATFVPIFICTNWSSRVWMRTLTFFSYNVSLIRLPIISIRNIEKFNCDIQNHFLWRLFNSKLTLSCVVLSSQHRDHVTAMT